MGKRRNSSWCWQTVNIKHVQISNIYVFYFLVGNNNARNKFSSTLEISPSTLFICTVLFVYSERITWRLSDCPYGSGNGRRACLHSIQYSSKVTEHWLRIISSFIATFIIKCQKIHFRKQIYTKTRRDMDLDAGAGIRVCTTWRSQWRR